MNSDEGEAPSEAPEVHPKDFLRALLHITPKDAEKAREDSPATRKRKPAVGPYQDYGNPA